MSTLRSQLSRGHRVWIAVVVGLGTPAACGGPAATGATPSAAPVPSVTAREAVGGQVFPKHPQYAYYVESVNFRKNGVAPAGGDDYSACPLTDRMRARLIQKQTHLYPAR